MDAPATTAVRRRVAEGLAALVGVQLCFGLSPLFAKWTLVEPGGFSPRALVGWRILFGSLALGALAAWRHAWELVPPRAELPRLFLCAALGIVANMELYMEGVRRTSALHTGLLVVQIPVFTYALACLVGAERVERRRLLGIVLALAGALVIVLQRPTAGEGGRLGNLLIVANCLCYAGYLVLVRSLLQRFPTWVVIAWVFWLSLPAVPVLFAGESVWPQAPEPRALGSFAYTLVFATFLAYWLNAFALARVPASTVAVFIFLQPLVAGVAGVLALGERVAWPAWLAAAFLLAGIWLVSRGPRAGTSDSIRR